MRVSLAFEFRGCSSIGGSASLPNSRLRVRCPSSAPHYDARRQFLTRTAHDGHHSRYADVVQPGRTRRCQRRGHGFEPHRPHHHIGQRAALVTAAGCKPAVPRGHTGFDSLAAHQQLQCPRSSAGKEQPPSLRHQCFVPVPGGTGRRAGLRTQCLRTSRFESGGTDQCCFTSSPSAPTIWGASSSGKTSRFERDNPGSNPGAPANRSPMPR